MFSHRRSSFCALAISLFRWRPNINVRLSNGFWSVIHFLFFRVGAVASAALCFCFQLFLFEFLSLFAAFFM